MIKPSKSYFHEKLLHWYLDKKFKSSFSSVNYIYDDEFDPSTSYLVVGNHSTWWDGFLIFQLNRDVFKKRYYCMMLENQLKKLWYFQKVGCFSIDPGSKTVIESLKYASNLLNEAENMVQFYPQGKLYSLYDESFTFSKGINIVLKNTSNTSFVFYALFQDYGSNEKPYLNIFLKQIKNVTGYTNLEVEELYKTFYNQSKQSHIKRFIS